MEADSGSTNLRTGGSIAGGVRSIASGGKKDDDKAKVYELHGKHFKWVAGSYFQKINQRSKTKGMGKTAQIIFKGIGTGLFGCGGDGFG